MGREDVKKVRTRLRWFTLIVTVLAGINSFFNGSIAQSNGTSATGIGGAFLTALFVLIVILIFISIPFNVLAFFVVRSNRYPEQDFRRISLVLTAFTVIVSLLVAVYSYFGGFVAGSTTLKGAGSVIYAVIFTVIVMIIVVVIPVHVVAFLFFAIRRVPEPEPPGRRPAGWTKEKERRFQQQLNPTLSQARADLTAQAHDTSKDATQFASDITKIAVALKGILLGSRIILSNEFFRELTLEWSTSLDHIADWAGYFRDIIQLLTSQPKTPEDRLIDAVHSITKQYIEQESNKQAQSEDETP